MNSPDYPSGGSRGFVPAAGDTVYIDGSNFTGTGAADTVTVSGAYDDPTVQVGGMGMVAATLTDTMGTVEAISTGVGMDNAGAGQGIGEAIARAFVAEGATVVLAERNADTGERLATELTQAGGAALFIQTDVTDAAAVDDMVARATRASARRRGG